MTVTSGIIDLTESVCKTGDSNNIKMHDVCTIALLDVFRNFMCIDEKSYSCGIRIGFIRLMKVWYYQLYLKFA
jgi:hypothetical protein